MTAALMATRVALLEWEFGLVRQVLLRLGRGG